MQVLDDERRKTLLILGCRVKDQLWHSVYKTLWAQYRQQFLPDHFQPSPVIYRWWEEEPYWFWVMGSKVKVNFGTLCVKPCGHYTDCSLSPFTFKLHMQIMDDERRKSLLIFGSEVKVIFCTMCYCIKSCGHNTTEFLKYGIPKGTSMLFTIYFVFY